MKPIGPILSAVGFILATISLIAPVIPQISDVIPYFGTSGILYGGILFIGGIMVWIGNGIFGYDSGDEE